MKVPEAEVAPPIAPPSPAPSSSTGICSYAGGEYIHQLHVTMRQELREGPRAEKGKTRYAQTWHLGTATIPLFSLLLITGCGWYWGLHISERKYTTYEEVVADGGIQYGWVPGWLPMSSKDIVILGNIDTNEIWIKFSYDTDELRSVGENCTRISVAEIAFPRTVSKAHVPWWSSALETRMREEALLYVCTKKLWDNPEVVGTLAMIGGDGYYWERGD